MSAMNINDMRVAAVQGKDWVTVALCVLAHPESVTLPDFFVRELSNVVMADGEPDAADAIIALTGSKWLDDVLAQEAAACPTA